MNISAINSSNLPNSHRRNQSTGADAQIRSLEQKLQKLNVEKQKAIQRKDEEQKKKIEKQIQEIEKQIQQLKQQEKEGTSDGAGVQEIAQHSSNTGKYTDVYG